MQVPSYCILMHSQTAVTAYLESIQLLLFVFSYADIKGPMPSNLQWSTNLSPKAVHRKIDDTTSNARRWTNVGLMLGKRRRRWPSIKPTLAQRLGSEPIWAWVMGESLARLLAPVHSPGGRPWYVIGGRGRPVSSSHSSVNLSAVNRAGPARHTQLPQYLIHLITR